MKLFEFSIEQYLNLSVADKTIFWAAERSQVMMRENSFRVIFKIQQVEDS